MKGKEFLILILIIVVGVIFYHAQTGKLDWDWGDGFFFSYDDFVYEESEEIAPPYPDLIKVVNTHGDVEIEGTEEDKISIIFKKRIWRRDEERAKEVSDRLKFTTDKTDQHILISTNRDEFRRTRFDTNFVIKIPEGMDVEVTNSYGHVKAYNIGKCTISNPYGEIYVEGASGATALKNRYEDIEVENVQSDCRIESRHSSVIALNIAGNAHVIHRYGKIHLEDIIKETTIEGSHSEVYGKNLTGQVNIDTSYKKIVLVNSGPIDIDTTRSPIEIDGAQQLVKIKNRYGKLKLDDIRGDLFVEGKDIQVTGSSIIGNSITISTSYRDVELTEFSGKVSITLSNGDIYLEPLPLTHPLDITGKYVDIKFRWPEGGKYPLEARTKGGDIHWELSDEPSSMKENGYSTIKAFIEELNNPKITISTTYGTIQFLD
jgi:hypothetical protein